ncbi:hypothetical protein QY96_01119 [Bacillus thermotolerans]|nr:hypothetical protein QY96_01119 [Bacillus thermotolerans]
MILSRGGVCRLLLKNMVPPSSMNASPPHLNTHEMIRILRGEE